MITSIYNLVIFKVNDVIFKVIVNSYKSLIHKEL